MQIVDEGLATVDLARAYQVEDVLLVRASGTKPTACHVVALEQSLLDVEPPAFVARVSTDPRVRCTADSAPFEEHRAFRVGTLRPQVLVRHSGGELTVDVEDLTSDIEAIGAGANDQAGSSLFGVGNETHEAVGYSVDYDLGEAMREAMAQLPSQGSEIPDWLASYTVVSIGAEVGGIAGFNHLTVRVSG